MDPSALLPLPARAWGTVLAPPCSLAPSLDLCLRSPIPSPAPSSWPALTQPHLARVGQVVVAGYIAPLSLVMPHHDHAVLSGQEVAVRLPRVPVLIELRGGDGGGSETLQHRSLREVDLEGLWGDGIMGPGRADRGAQGKGGAGRGKGMGKGRSQKKEWGGCWVTGVGGRSAWKRDLDSARGGGSLSPGGRHLTTGNRLRWFCH